MDQAAKPKVESESAPTPATTDALCDEPVKADGAQVDAEEADSEQFQEDELECALEEVMEQAFDDVQDVEWEESDGDEEEFKPKHSVEDEFDHAQDQIDKWHEDHTVHHAPEAEDGADTCALESDTDEQASR